MKSFAGSSTGSAAMMGSGMMQGVKAKLEGCGIMMPMVFEMGTDVIYLFDG